MIRATPRTSPENAAQKLPWVRRKELKEKFAQDPDKFMERFEELLELFQKLLFRYRHSKLMARKLQNYRKLKPVANSLMDYLECGTIEFENKEEFYRIRNKANRFC